MSLTKITWEEFDTFDKIESPKGYDFRTHEGKYYTFGEFGVASVRRIFEINPADFSEYLLGRRTAHEIDFKAQNDCWPLTEEEKNEIKKVLEIYKKIMNSNYKPENTRINLEKMYKTCYLVDCPMHQKLD